MKEIIIELIQTYYDKSIKESVKCYEQINRAEKKAYANYKTDDQNTLDINALCSMMEFKGRREELMEKSTCIQKIINHLEKLPTNED